MSDRVELWRGLTLPITAQKNISVQALDTLGLPVFVHLRVRSGSGFVVHIGAHGSCDAWLSFDETRGKGMTH